MDTESLHRDPSMGICYLRALCEVGDLRGALELYSGMRPALQGRTYDLHRHICQLALFAFAGRPKQVASLLTGHLQALDAETSRYWLTVASEAAYSAADGMLRLVTMKSTEAELRQAEHLRQAESDESRSLRLEGTPHCDAPL